MGIIRRALEDVPKFGVFGTIDYSKLRNTLLLNKNSLSLLFLSIFEYEGLEELSHDENP